MQDRTNENAVPDVGAALECIPRERTSPDEVLHLVTRVRPHQRLGDGPIPATGQERRASRRAARAPGKARGAIVGGAILQPVGGAIVGGDIVGGAIVGGAIVGGAIVSGAIVSRAPGGSRRSHSRQTASQKRSPAAPSSAAAPPRKGSIL
eukprot:scaffold113413_cov51-Phaeocystis_antarctica.AAC.2